MSEPVIAPIFADAGVSISDLKKNPSAVIAAAEGFPVAILNRNTPQAYLVPAAAWEAMLERLDDFDLAEIVRGRLANDEVPVKVDLADL